MSISQYSLASLFLIASINDIQLGSATGFIVNRNGKNFLITNWHVLAGRNPSTGQPTNNSGGIPNNITVHFVNNHTPSSIEWVPIKIMITDSEGKPLWLEHPVHTRSVDVVALELDNLENYKIIQYELNPQNPIMRVRVANDLSIIGFPFGISAGGLFGIWLRGSIASEPTLNYENLPSFLIDARTRQGQSGSPVISYSSGGLVELENGDTSLLGETVNLQGVYSGRINKESDIGIVWKKSVITEIIDGGKLGNNHLMAS